MAHDGHNNLSYNDQSLKYVWGMYYSDHLENTKSTISE